MNLYPYNLYILLLALIILFIYICLTFKKLKTLSKTIENTLVKVASIQTKTNALLTSILTKVENQKVICTNALKAIKIYALWNAVFKDYKKQDAKGFKQLHSSATHVIQKKQANTLVYQVLARMISE